MDGWRDARRERAAIRSGKQSFHCALLHLCQLGCHEPAGALRSVDHKEQSKGSVPKMQCEKYRLAKKTLARPFERLRR